MKQAIKTKPQAQVVQPQAGITVFVVVPRPSAHLSYNEKLGNPYIVRQAEFLGYRDRFGGPAQYSPEHAEKGTVKLDKEITRLTLSLEEIHVSRKDAIKAANETNRNRAKVLEDAAKALRKFKAT